MAVGKTQLAEKAWICCSETRTRPVSVTQQHQVSVVVEGDAVGVGGEGRLKLSHFVTQSLKILFFFFLNVQSGATCVLTKQFCHELNVT